MGQRISVQGQETVEPPQYTNAFDLLKEMRSTLQTYTLDNKLTDYGVSAFLPEEGQLLYDLVIQNRCKMILEVGMERGTSSLYLTQAVADLGEGAVISMDPLQFVFPAWGSGVKNIQRAGLSKFHSLVNHPSEIALPKLSESMRDSVDFIFNDGNHRYDQTMLEVFYGDPMLKVGGFMAFHDLHLPSIQAVVSWLQTNLNYELLEVPTPALAVLRKTEIDRREWDYFRPFTVSSESTGTRKH